MSALEIEDVLSSIRRLVSDELRPIRRASRSGVALDTKLLLTPALRVVPDVTVHAPRDTGTIIGRVADALAPETDFEAETGDPAPQSMGLAQPWQQESGSGDAEMAVDAEAEEEPAEKLVFRSRQVLGDRSLVILEPESGPFLESPSPEVIERLMADEVWAQQGSQDETETIATTDTPIESVLPDPQADHAWADLAEAEVMANLLSVSEADYAQHAKPEAAASNPLEATGSEAGPQLDEAQLRNLVRELIREELQGGLGERITRNIRKLVRAEIARAMALHDFE